MRGGAADKRLVDREDPEQPESAVKVPQCWGGKGSASLGLSDALGLVELASSIPMMVCVRLIIGERRGERERGTRGW